MLVQQVRLDFQYANYALNEIKLTQDVYVRKGQVLGISGLSYPNVLGYYSGKVSNKVLDYDEWKLKV